MTLAVDGDQLADCTIAALNALTHNGAVIKAGKSGKYTLLTVSAPPPPNLHQLCFLLVYRTIISPYTCKIKVSPGIDVGTDIDPSSTSLENISQIGGGTTQAKDTRSASNPAQFDTWYESLARYIKPEWFGTGGSNAKIIWNPFPAETRNWIGNKATPTTVPAWLVLAHELSHADRIMRGTSLIGVVGRAAPPKYNAKVAGTTYETMVDIEHIEMVGFTCPSWACKDADVVTENAIRTEHNIALRCNY